LWIARVAAAAATSATFLTNRFVSSGVRPGARVGGWVASWVFLLAEPFPVDSALPCLSVVGVDAGCSPRKKRELILSPIRLRKGSSGMLFRQFARATGDGWVGGIAPYSGPWIGISQIWAAWVRSENQSPMT
jgi:hypothetical protein